MFSLNITKEFLHYDPKSGIFTWIKTTTNRVKIGDVVGSPTKNGYLDTSFFNQRILLHRLAWFYMTGELPLLDIDHRNGNRIDNSWRNLRVGTRQFNLQNMRVPGKLNKTGFLGASFDNGKYRAQIRVNGAGRFLGRFDTPEEAHAAYVKAKRLHHLGCTI